jgi:UDP-glucose 4-epimerase
VRERAGSSSEIVYVPYDEAYGEGFEDMQRRIPDARKLERLTGYRFETPLRRIVDDVVAEQRERLDA